MEIKPTDIVCACKQVEAGRVMDYIGKTGKPATAEEVETLKKACEIGQSCRACINKKDYKYIDVSLENVLKNA